MEEGSERARDGELERESGISEWTLDSFLPEDRACQREERKLRRETGGREWESKRKTEERCSVFVTCCVLTAAERAGAAGVSAGTPQQVSKTRSQPGGRAAARAGGSQRGGASGSGGRPREGSKPAGEGRYLVDPASSHMLVSKIKPCMS